MPPSSPSVTELLQAWGRGDTSARDQLVPAVYQELRLQAHRYLQRVTLEDAVAVAEARGIDLLELDEALIRLAELDAQLAKVVELRYFAGLGIEETARALEISPATVRREWAMARAWLRRDLAHDHQIDPSVP